MNTEKSQEDRYMAILIEFQTLAKMSKGESRDRAAILLASVEEYHESYPKIPIHQHKMLDRIEDNARARLDMPRAKRSVIHKLKLLF